MNNIINKQIGLVTVTCKRDFELIAGLLETINQYIGDEFDHTIILNDSVDHMPELLSVCDQYPRPNRTIIHCDDVGEFKNHKEACHKEYHACQAQYPEYNHGLRGSRTGGYLVGWSLAQILICYFAQVCQTEYYTILTSRCRIVTHWDLINVIQHDKSPVALSTQCWDELKNDFKLYFEISYGIFGLDWQKESSMYTTPSTNTPYFWKTSYMLDLLSYTKEKKNTIFDYVDPYNNPRSACDAYLYSAWLRFKELTDTTYVTSFDGIVTEVR